MVMLVIKIGIAVTIFAALIALIAVAAGFTLLILIDMRRRRQERRGLMAVADAVREPGFQDVCECPRINEAGFCTCGCRDCRREEQCICAQCACRLVDVP